VARVAARWIRDVPALDAAAETAIGYDRVVGSASRRGVGAIRGAARWISDVQALGAAAGTAIKVGGAREG